MDKETIMQRLKPIRCFLLDLDGTFYLGNQLLNGSLAFLDQTLKTGRQTMFLTNNSSKSAEAYVEKLSRIGVQAPFLRVLTSGQASAQFALGTYPGKRAYVLGTQALRTELENAGLEIDDRNPDYVLVGYDTTLNYEKMTRVCDLLRAGLPYIATYPDNNCPTGNGFAPDIGAIIAFIEASTGRSPNMIIGKPHQGIVNEAIRRTGFRADELAMIGDRLYTDIAMAARHGMLGVLVLTGEAKMKDIKGSPEKPDLVFNRLSDIIQYL